MPSEPHLDIEKLDEAYHDGTDQFLSLVSDLDIGVGIYNRNASPIAFNKAAH